MSLYSFDAWEIVHFFGADPRHVWPDLDPNHHTPRYTIGLMRADGLVVCGDAHRGLGGVAVAGRTGKPLTPLPSLHDRMTLYDAFIWRYVRCIRAMESPAV